MQKTQNQSGRQPGVKNKSRMALWMLFNFIWMFLLYQGSIHLSSRLGTIALYEACTIVYAVVLIALLLLYRLRAQEARAARLGAERENASAADAAQAAQATARAKSLLIWIFPISVIFLIDLSDLFIVEYFKQLFSSFL